MISPAADRTDVLVDERPTWVYFLCCVHVQPIYIGITCQLDRRMREHRKAKRWWPEVRHIEAALFPTRSEARGMERNLIAKLGPQYNYSGRRSGLVDDTLGVVQMRSFIVLDGDRPIPLVRH